MTANPREDRIPRENGRRAARWGLAIALAVTAQIAVLSPFMTASENKEKGGAGAGEKVYFIDGRHYKDLASFLKYADPEALSKPDQALGFSSVIRKIGATDRLPEALPSWRDSEIKFTPADTKIPGLVKDGANQSDILLRLWRTIEPPSPVSAGKPAQVSYPLCADQEGRIIEIPISADEVEIMAKENPPKYATALSVSYEGASFPSVRIALPSGNDGLDRFAADKLIVFSRVVQKLSESAPGGKVNLFFHWRKGLRTCPK